MAKIAVERGAAADSKRPAARLLAQGDGWAVHDVLCGAGPRDRAFEELHSTTTLAVVVAGTFQYRSRSRRELMIPGSLLLGNAGDAFECGHEHATGDRCVSFSYAPETFESLFCDSGARASRPAFRAIRIPPLRLLSPYLADVSARLRAPSSTRWEELAIDLPVQVLRLDDGISSGATAFDSASTARVTRVVRGIENGDDAAQSVHAMAREARLSPYHFLRTFHAVTGMTPHQYLLRIRLCRAALRIASEPDKILDIALACGFGDVSNFNRTFRSEFGVSPRIYRKAKLASAPDFRTISDLPSPTRCTQCQAGHLR